jgi:hypothetical protein
MSEPFVFITTHTINDGMLDQIEELGTRFTELVEASDTGLLAFHFYVSDDGSEIASVQVHSDAASMDAYLPIVGEMIASALELSRTDRIDVCGEPVQNPVPTIRRAEYVDRPILADASGMEVPVAGGAVLQLVLGGASAFDAEGNPPQPSYTGPTRIEANLPSIIEVVETGDFESVLSFAIGVRDGAAGGTAQVLTGPTRVIVDVPHVVTPVVVSPNFTG